MDTLAVRLTVPPVGSVEDFHLQVGAPCRAHHKKTRGPGRAIAFRFDRLSSAIVSSPLLAVVRAVEGLHPLFGPLFIAHWGGCRDKALAWIPPLENRGNQRAPLFASLSG